MFSQTSNDNLEMENSFICQKSFNEIIENISMPSEFFNESTFIEPSLTEFSHSKLSEVSETNYTLECTDYLLKEINDGLKIKKFIDKSLEDEIDNFKQLLNEVCRAQIQRSKTKFILNSLTDILENSSELPNSLKEKCNNRLEFCNLMKTLKYNTEIMKKFDIQDIGDSFVLTDGERRLIQSTIRKEIDTKCSEIKQENEIILECIGYRPKKMMLPGTTFTEENGKILNLINDIVEAIKLCSVEVNKVKDFIKDLHEIRICKFQKLHKEEVDFLFSKTQLLGLEMKNLNYMIENAIVHQNDNIIRAVDVLHKDLKNGLDEVEYSLQRTKTVKELYDKLEGTRFREILKEFLDLRESYNHKMWALRQIQNPD